MVTLDASYYSIIERDDEGRFFAWVPDLPGVRVEGATEEEVVRALSQQVRQCLREMILSGRDVPPARLIDELAAQAKNGRVHRLLLLIG